jgi:integrase
MSPLTQKAYVRAVKNFSKHFGKSPDQLTFEHVREYQLHLGSRGLGVQAINQIMCGLRFFYGTTLGKAAVSELIPLGRRPDALPPVLARDEVERFLKAVSDFEFRTAFVTIYAAGLRVSEAVALTIKDIDSARMVIHIRSGKGRKDRYVMLSEQLLGILRAYWRCARPQHFLFPGPDPARPITVRSLQRACRLAAETAGLDKMVTVPRCGTASPRTCWSKGWTSVSFRTCWDTGMSTPLLGMPGSQSIRSDRSKVPLTP